MRAPTEQPRRPAAAAFRSGLAAANARRWARARQALAAAVAGAGPEASWAAQELIQTHLAEGTVEAGERSIRTGLPAGALRDHALGYLFRRTGRHDQAAALFARALAARPPLAAAASELGMLLCQRGQRQRGLRLLRRAEAHFRRRGDDWGLSIAVAQRATQALETLALRDAVRLYRQALVLKRRCGDRVGEGAVLHNLGLAQYYLAEYDAAAATLGRALALQRARGDRRGTAFSLNTLGLVELDLASPSRAAVFLREASRHFRRLGESRGLATALINLAEARRLRGDLAEAARALRAARALERAAGYADGWGMAVANLAATLTAQGRGRAALAALRTFPAAAHRQANGRTRLVLGRERARALLAVGEAARALVTVRAVLARLDRQRSSRHTEVAELEAGVVEGEALLAVGRSPESLLLARRLARRVEGLLRRHPVAGTRIGLLETHRTVHDLWLRLLSADRVANLAPAWRIVAGLKGRELAGRGPSRRRPPRAALPPLAAGEALLEYHVSGATTWAFVRAGERAAWLDLGLPERRLALAIARLLEPLQAAGGSPDPAIDLSRFEPARAGQLERWLIAPVVAVIAGPLRRLLVVPHGPLHRLPFELLLGPGRVSGRGADRTPVITYLPSSQDRRGRRRRPDPSRFLGVAYSPPAPARSGPAGRRLAPLPEALREVADIARLYPRRKLLVGPAATAEALTRAAPAASVIHVAAHASADLLEPGRSGILLARGKPAGGVEQSELLRAAPIARLGLGAPLVVLSACESQVGRLRVHEGAQGLARAFLEAGAEAVIASMWRVDDAATRQLMLALHRGLRAGAGRAEALASARDSLQRSAAWAHPYFWAAFVLIERRS